VLPFDHTRQVRTAFEEPDGATMSQAAPSIGNHPCQGHRQDGQPCRVRALTGAGFCFAHDPASADQRAQARRRGGQNRATSRRAQKLMPARLQPIFARLEKALEQTHEGRLDPKTATAMAQLARALVAVLTRGELEARLRELEGRAS
jgi:hypothetical protein